MLFFKLTLTEIDELAFTQLTHLREYDVNVMLPFCGFHIASPRSDHVDLSTLFFGGSNVAARRDNQWVATLSPQNHVTFIPPASYLFSMFTNHDATTRLGSFSSLVRFVPRAGNASN